MKKTVLLVEDDPSLAAAIEAKLEKNDFDILPAKTMDQALEYCRTRQNIDVLWLDHYLLGRGTGLDLLEKIKTIATYQHVPAFVVSNTASPDKRQSYLKLGATQFYVKAEHRLEEIIADIKASIGPAEQASAA